MATPRVNQMIASGRITHAFRSEGGKFNNFNLALDVGRDRTAYQDLACFGRLVAETNDWKEDDIVTVLTRPDSVKSPDGTWRRRLVALAILPNPDVSESDPTEVEDEQGVLVEA